MTATAALVALLVSASQQTPAQTVSITDVLVEAQTLYTLAVDKQPESLTAALDLARQAQRAIADDAIRKRLPAGAHADAQDLTVLGSLRARTGILVDGLDKRREYFIGQYEDIQKLLERKRFDEARLALQHLPPDAPLADPACPFADLRAELDRSTALTRTKAASAPGPSNRKWIIAGTVSAAVFTVSALAAHNSMNASLDQLSFLPPSSLDWWTTSNDAEQMRRIRNGFAVAALGTGVALAIYGAARAARNNTAAGRSPSPSRSRTLVGFTFDPRGPAITVVKIF
jgi:hypothetical protein